MLIGAYMDIDRCLKELRVPTGAYRCLQVGSLGMFKNHFLSPIDPRLSPDFAFGATDTTKKFHRPTPSGNSGSRHAHFLAYFLYR